MNPITLAGGEHAVLLIHGLQSSPAEMQPLAKRLNQSGYTVHMPHIHGYGYEHGDDAHSVTHWEDWHAKVLAEFHTLKQQHKTVAIGGLCIGAVLSLSIAAKLGDEVTALALLSTTLYYDGWSIPWYRFLLPIGYYTPFRYIYSYREREPFGLKNKQLRKWVAREMRHKDSSMAGAAKLSLPAVHEAELLIKSVKKSLPHVTSPALIIHAIDDDISTPRSARFVVDNIGSKTVESILLHDSYHMLTIDNDREQVAADTIRFFNAVCATREDR
jgi:carboxylesterase